MTARQHLVIFVMLAVIGVVAAVSGFMISEQRLKNQPVCHSETEDSVITDCDYYDGGWHKK